VAARRLPLLLIAAAASASIAGCSTGDTPFGFGGGGHSRNSADVTFLHSMSDHEKATLGITRLAERRALRRELRGIARSMTSEQQHDLGKLGLMSRGARKSSGAQPPAVRDAVSAMVDLTRVKDAESFDYEFMRTMLEQNQAAIAICEAESRHGSDAAVKRLAAAIEAQRKRELARIHGWLRLWYGDVQPGGHGPGPPGGGGGQSPAPGSPSPSPGGAPHVPL
jgi:uncharacterized protein (DUF305 family)